MIEVNIKINTKEYWEFRKEKIGASDAPTIMGESPWKTPYQLWKEKMSSEEIPSNSAMQRGKALEPIARELASKQLGMEFEEGVVLLHPDYSHMMMASLDGFDRKRGIILEIKCPGPKDHAEALKGRLPTHYYAQCQHQLACLPQAKESYYFSFNGEDGVAIKVEKNEEYIRYMIEKEKDFFNYMQTLTPPPQQHADIEMRTDEEWNQIAQEYLYIEKEFSEIKEKLESARSKLIELAKDKSSQGAGVILKKIETKGRLEYSSIPELANIDLEKYRQRGSQHWRIDKMGDKKYGNSNTV